MREALVRRVAQEVQARVVLPHCDSCLRPCCRLETLVLELDWKRLKALHGLEMTRATFDRMLDAGEGPEDIRPQDGRYYAHGSPCPAYRGRRCSVYGTRLKPPGCSDFPVYEEEGRLVADLRCEALNVSAVESFLCEVAPAQLRVVAMPDPEFPFLVRFRTARRGRPSGRRSKEGTRQGLDRGDPP